MTDTAVITHHQVTLQELTAFCGSLAARLQPLGMSGDRLRAVFAQALSAECTQCGVRVSGEELFALIPEPSTSPSHSPRTARLSQGYCARHDCPSYYYRVDFHPQPGVDWPTVLNQLGADSTPDALPAALPTRAGGFRLVLGLKVSLLQVAAGLLIVILLLLIRQWYIGGTIPLIRQPESFSVDPSSVGEPPKP